MQTATSETESKSLDISICVHHYTLRAPCPKGQGIFEVGTFLFFSPNTFLIQGTCVQYPGLQGGGALGDASTPGTPAGAIAASAHGGTYSHAAVAGRIWGGERGAAAATAAAAARRRRATPTGGAVTPPRSASAHGGQGGRHGARAGGWD